MPGIFKMLISKIILILLSLDDHFTNKIFYLPQKEIRTPRKSLTFEDIQEADKDF
jgi:hypothetical protein